MAEGHARARERLAAVMGDGGDWEQEAENWVRWARTPMHDSYWYYRESFFEKIVPPAGGRTIEVGCGEGRVARDLRSRGHRVVAVDASPTLLRHAREADPGGTYLIGDARALPFADASFDIAVAYNSLMDVDGMPEAVRESARLLVPGGYLCICVTHPLNDAGRFEGKEPDAPFVIRDSYLGKRKFDERFERGGLAITFHGWCYPLEDYIIALEEAGFTIERLREPRASDEALAAGGPSELRWRRVPLFLHILARKR